MPRRVCADALEAGLVRGAALGGDAEDDHALEAKAALEALHGVDLDADADLFGLAGADDLGDDAGDGVDGDGEADARGAAAAAEDHRVHADELAGRVEQRARRSCRG